MARNVGHPRLDPAAVFPGIATDNLDHAQRDRMAGCKIPPQLPDRLDRIDRIDHHEPPEREMHLSKIMRDGISSRTHRVITRRQTAAHQ